jgi:hypothetical protein
VPILIKKRMGESELEAGRAYPQNFTPSFWRTENESNFALRNESFLL